MALIRTGWARHFERRDTTSVRPTACPGATDGRRALARRRRRACRGRGHHRVRADPGRRRGTRVLPVHRILLVESGIHIIEHLNLEDAAAAGLTEFAFVMAPLRIVGGDRFAVRPFAAVAA